MKISYFIFKIRDLAGVFLISLAAVSPAFALHPDLPDPDFGFRSFYVTWGGTTNAVFEQFLREVRPEIVQCGFYGPLFHGYADDPKSVGYPMQLPVSGQREALAVQRETNRLIHKLGLKVVGHFQMVNVIGNLAKTNGFLAFYEKGWPEELLGPRPCPDVRELMMRDAAGKILASDDGFYLGLCPSSPYARALLKSMLKLAVGTGLDGVMVNYNYRWNCACPYCQADFRRWLGGRFSADELRKEFGIVDLDTYRFDEIKARIPGYPATNAPALDREEMRWAATAYKRAFDEIFIDYGRSLKKDLIVSTWNHLSDMSVFEERAFLPLEQWGRGENYFWYSEGNVLTKLAEHKLGDSWVDSLWLREMGGGKPFMLGKYEPVRVRNNVAEALATGGSGMGLYMTISEPEGYRRLSAYLRFPRKFPELYQGLEPEADCALLWPRVAIQAGDYKAAETFRDAGRILSDRQVPFEVLVDGNVATSRLARYTTLLLPQGAALSPTVNGMLDDFTRRGGSVLPITRETALGLADQLKPNARYAVDASWTVKMMPWTGKGRRVLHLVNYNRDEARAAGLPQTPAAECPIAAEKIACRVILPQGARVSSVRLYAPEAAKPESLPFEVKDGRVCFVIPRVEVYAVVEIRGKGL